MSESHHADGRGSGKSGPAPVASTPDVQSDIEPDVESAPTLPPTPAAAAVVFGDRLEMARRFAELLADTGVSHGLIGPREVPILWERHILNCAVAHEAFPADAEVVDVGSGAGLPGLALAIARPDLRLHLVEPMLRRTTWLEDAVRTLGLDNVTVHRGRAEEFRGVLSTAYATARAVARIDKLARWTFPLLADGGTLIALKGSNAADELSAEEATLRRLGMRTAAIRSYGESVLDVATVTLELTIGSRPAVSGGKDRSSGRSVRRRGR